MIKFINGNNEIILDEKEFEISFQNLDEKTIRLDFYKPTTDVDIYSFNLNINIEENITFILNDFLEKKYT